MNDKLTPIGGDLSITQDGSIVHTPKNEIVEISEVWAFVSVDPKDNTEGIMSMAAGSGWLPLLAADAARLIQITPMVERMVKQSGIPARLIKLSKREVVKEFKP